MNPDFVIPLAANFKLNGLSNKVEQRVRANAKQPSKLVAGLTEDQMSLIWEGSGKEVGAIINKHYNAVYNARVAYCKANPTFVIPAISGFKPPIEVTNPVETVQPAVEAVVEPVITVVEEVAEPAIKKKRGRKPKESVVAIAATTLEATQAPVEQPVAQPVAQNTMAEMFALLTASGMKPKKATFKNGEVNFEF
jgi:hypothetical protein